MGVVYRGRDDSLDRDVALKVMSRGPRGRRTSARVPARGPRRRAPAAPEHRHHLRAGRARGRALHRHGAARGRGPAARDRGRHAPEPAGDAAHRAAAARRPGPCPRARHRPSRREAVQPLPAPRPAGQDHGLRRGPAGRRHHLQRAHRGHAELHVARAGAGGDRGRPQRPLLGGPHPLRAGHGREGLPGRFRRVPDVQDRPRGPGPPPDPARGEVGPAARGAHARVLQGRRTGAIRPRPRCPPTSPSRCRTWAGALDDTAARTRACSGRTSYTAPAAARPADRVPRPSRAKRVRDPAAGRARAALRPPPAAACRRAPPGCGRRSSAWRCWRRSPPGWSCSCLAPGGSRRPTPAPSLAPRGAAVSLVSGGTRPSPSAAPPSEAPPRPRPSPADGARVRPPRAVCSAPAPSAAADRRRAAAGSPRRRSSIARAISTSGAATRRRWPRPRPCCGREPGNREAKSLVEDTEADMAVVDAPQAGAGGAAAGATGRKPWPQVRAGLAVNEQRGRLLSLFKERPSRAGLTGLSTALAFAIGSAAPGRPGARSPRRIRP